MQLNVTTDYAIRMVLYLAMNKTVVSSLIISEDMKIPQKYVTILTRRLQDADIVRSERGPSGGYTLVREAWDITLFDVIDAMEGTTRINRCLEPDHYCSRHATDDCPVRRNYERLQRIWDDTLSGITIESLI